MATIDGYSSYEDMARALGFPAVQAAARTQSALRNADLGQTDIEMAGEEERRLIDAGYEGRGTYNSGERKEALARQEAQQAQRSAKLEQAKADDLSGIELGLLSSSAQAQQNAYAQQQQQLMQQEQLMRAMSLAQYDSTRLLNQSLSDPFSPWGMLG